MLIEKTLFGTNDKVKEAIERIKAFSFNPDKPYRVAFSGGKDSIVIKKLCDLAKVNYYASYSVTSVDPPELIYFIKENYPDVKFDIPTDTLGNRITMWNLIPKKLMPPTRLVRYCCTELKEKFGSNEITITGVRWAESTNRKNNQDIISIFNAKGLPEKYKRNKKGGIILDNDNEESRKLVESCYKYRKTLLNPIIDWSDDDVWEFIDLFKIPYCSLYNCGYKRLGCIGCPMSSKAKEELDIYPKYKQNYLNSFKRMLIERRSRNIKTEWEDEYDVYNWWLNIKEQDYSLPGQIVLDDLLEGDS